MRLRYHTRAYIDHLEREANYKSLQSAKKQLKLLSYQDETTLIPDRRAFDALFHREWQRSLRETIALSVMFLDIDYFHRYNEFYGRLAGDDCLKEVVTSVQKKLQRPTDFLARYDSETLAIILPCTHGHGAMLVAERLRKGIESLNLEHQTADTFDFVSISVGVATTSPMIKHRPQEFIQMARQALLEAKQLGRNQVICKSI